MLHREGTKLDGVVIRQLPRHLVPLHAVTDLAADVAIRTTLREDAREVHMILHLEDGRPRGLIEVCINSLYLYISCMSYIIYLILSWINSP